jgi:hypothetical protein
MPRKAKTPAKRKTSTPAKPGAAKPRPNGKAPNKSWMPGRKGQGGEGLSKGYGGSAGEGTGASGPEQVDDADIERKFPSLPSRERIARVLR